jgi:hypothetical protein
LGKTEQNLIQEKIEEDWIRVMLVTFRSKTFCVRVCSLQSKN